MTDQIPADKVRDLRDQYARLIEDAGTKEAHAYYGHVVDDLEALLPPPPRPTLADMTKEERRACKWMQADVENRSVRYVIATPCDEEYEVALIDADGEIDWMPPERVTPRPDLPRMKWPGTEKPDPALPGVWRLADHEDHGRVIVTNTTTAHDGRVYYVLPAVDPRGYDWLWCDHSELTYLDQEADQ